MRPILICAAAAMCAVMLGCGGTRTPPGICGPNGGPLTHGPFVGSVSPATASIWIRGCEHDKVAVEYRLSSDDWAQARSTKPRKVSAQQDDTLTFLLADLQPKTDYTYRMKVNGLTEPSIEGEFKTMPEDGASGKLTFAMGTDLHFPHFSGSPIIESMAATHPDFSFFIGDNIVVDQALEAPLPNQSQSDYENIYKTSWADNAFKVFRSRNGSFLMWDDHDIYDDWDLKTAIPYPYARAAYDEYAGAANPAPRTPGGVNYLVKAGDIEFYVLDTRSFRSTRDTPDGPDKTMLGPDQKHDVEDWLATSRARLKFLVSSVWWNDLSRHVATGDPWASYKTERDEIFDFIRRNNVSGVILISGDEHSTMVLKLAPSGLYEFTPGPLNWALDTPQKDPRILYESSWLRTFGLITTDTTVCPATVKMELKGEDGKTRYTLNLDEHDLSTAPLTCTANR
jgi:alkaline phosphatase D